MQKSVSLKCEPSSEPLNVFDKEGPQRQHSPHLRSAFEGCGSEVGVQV